MVEALKMKHYKEALQYAEQGEINVGVLSSTDFMLQTVISFDMLALLSAENAVWTLPALEVDADNQVVLQFQRLLEEKVQQGKLFASLLWGKSVPCGLSNNNFHWRFVQMPKMKLRKTQEAACKKQAMMMRTQGPVLHHQMR